MLLVSFFRIICENWKFWFSKCFKFYKWNIVYIEEKLCEKKKKILELFLKKGKRMRGWGAMNILPSTENHLTGLPSTLLKADKKYEKWALSDKNVANVCNLRSERFITDIKDKKCQAIRKCWSLNSFKIQNTIFCYLNCNLRKCSHVTNLISFILVAHFYVPQ